MVPKPMGRRKHSVDCGSRIPCLIVGAAHDVAPSSSRTETNPGRWADHSGAVAPAAHSACQRSGSSSSIRLAGWVLIRSSTSRR